MRRKNKAGDNHIIDTLTLNNMTYLMYYNKLLDIILSSITWVNLPPSVDERYLELALLRDAQAVFFEDEVLGYLALKVTGSGKFDVYHNPMDCYAYADNGYRAHLNLDNSVIIYNNYSRTNELNTLAMFAMRLYEIERTIDVNVKNQKTPKLITGKENQVLALKNLYMKYEGNIPVIFADNNLEFKAINVLDTSSPFIADKMQILKRQIWNEALTFYGIDNNVSEKRERLVSTESISNVAAIDSYRNIRMSARQQACEKINAMFGLNIEVRFRGLQLKDMYEMEVNVNEPVHNAN